VRDTDQGGYLRAATPAELQQQRETRVAEAEAQERFEAEALEPRILTALGDAPGLSKNALAKCVRGNRQAVGRAVDALVTAGQLQRVSAHGYARRDHDDPQGELS